MRSQPTVCVIRAGRGRLRRPTRKMLCRIVNYFPLTAQLALLTRVSITVNTPYLIYPN